MTLTLLLRRTASLVAIALLAGSACAAPFPRIGSRAQLTVAVTSGNLGSEAARLPISFSTPAVITVEINALTSGGTLDDTFNGWVRLSSKPGSVTAVAGDGVSGRSVRLARGVARNIQVSLVAAYGDTRIWAEDDGYVPTDPGRTRLPQCSDGVDNNGNGLVDYPLDPGCAFANDDTEDGGSYATGVSDTLFFTRPRIADVRGFDSGGVATPFKSEQVSLDTGYDTTSQQYQFSTVITRISSNGFYMKDLGDKRGFSSVYAFTFSSPPRLRVCDRLKTLTGTSTEFFGMTQLASPTWTVEYWNRNEPCLVPEPYVFTLADLGPSSIHSLFRHESDLVRVETAGRVTVHVGGHLGPDSPAAPAFTPTASATNCDLDHNGRVDFSAGSEEATCADNCKNDVECSEYSNFIAQSNFNLVLVDADGTTPAKVQANGSSSPQFDAILSRGHDVRAFTGTLVYFSGGTQFTIEARCEDDIVTDLTATPLTSAQACVRPRSDLDNNEASQ